eukprot:TRINITY_DN1214_c0_g1_i1.p1 TRINITY_DN1214_c0_g1~~TRINITY_DN1214_c0_g1_i1.p1  ORF type:complete len:363 (+),score=82.39 TRINITY_DN1214_c0_g1_i1:93-1181(+)
MAPRQSRSRMATRAVCALGLSVLGLRRWHGPAYTVKGSWEGEPSSLTDYSAVMKELEPVVTIPALGYSGGKGVSLSLADGKLSANYAGQIGEDTQFSLTVDQDEAWRASLESGKTVLAVRGQGTNFNDVAWEASQAGSAAGVGDVLLEFNSDSKYNLTVTNDDLADIAGTHLAVKAKASNDGVQHKLVATRALPNDASLKYTLEHDVGVYDVDQYTHEAELSMPVAGGDAALKIGRKNAAMAYESSYKRVVQGGDAAVKLSYVNDGILYNVSYARDVGSGAAAVVGVDNEGVYSKLAATRGVADGLDAAYEAQARAKLGSDGSSAELSHGLKLSHKLGHVLLTHGTSEKPRIRLGYEFGVDA